MMMMMMRMMTTIMMMVNDTSHDYGHTCHIKHILINEMKNAKIEMYYFYQSISKRENTKTSE